MKAQHKTMLMTALVAILLLAIINNVSVLEPVKEQVNGNKGWF